MHDMLKLIMADVLAIGSPALAQWESQAGKVGEMHGQMALANYRFVEDDESTFTKPDDARIDALPTAGVGG